MVNDCVLEKVLDKIKEKVGTENFDDIYVLIDIDNKLQDHITLKNVVKLIACFIKDNAKFSYEFFQKKHYLLNKFSGKKNTFFIDKKQYKGSGTILAKINTFMKYL